jgi:L,D-transpeptidase ErfK/SrfK
MEPSRNSPPANGTAPTAAGPDAAPASRPAPKRQAAVPPPRVARRLGPVPLDWLTALAAGLIVLIIAAVAVWGTGYQYEPYAQQPLTISDQIPADARPLQQFTTRLRSRQRELNARLASLAPRGVYIVIDQTQNRIYLKKGDQTVLDAVCSAGSGMVLRERSGKKREWVFDSPRGRFEVLSMSRNPVWAKPDWAFVEDGEPIPKNPADRLDYGSLGEYALNFGNGYMIHGTLYERLLGRAVSHGCIRVGRDDLRKVWANSRIGTQIFIY